MPNNELKAKITADVTDFNSKMSEIGATANASAGVVTAAIGAATVALAGFALASKNAARDSETQRIQLIGLFRDIEKGDRVFAKLEKLADNSALKTEELIESFLTLGRQVGATTASEDFLEILEDIGFASKQGSGSFQEAADSIGKLINRFELFGKIDQDTLDTLKRTSGVSNEFIKSLQKLDLKTLKTSKLIGMMKDEIKLSSKVMKDEAIKSAQGLEDLLSGKLSEGFRKAGSESEAYKNLLRELISLMDRLIKSGVLEQLGTEIGKVFTEIAKLVQDEGAVLYIKDLADAFITLAKAIDLALTPLKTFMVARGTIAGFNAANRQNQLGDLLNNLNNQGVDTDTLKAIRAKYGGELGGDLGSVAKVKEFNSLLEASKSGNLSVGNKGTAVYLVDPKTGATWDVNLSNKTNKTMVGE